MQRPDEVGGIVFDDATFLYNPMVVVRVPRQGGSDFRHDSMTATPVELEEAERRLETMRRLMRDNPGGYDKVVDCYLEKVRIPKMANEQDRMNAAWAAVWFPWAANKQDQWLVRHYRLQVLDSEAAIGEERCLAQTTVLQRKLLERVVAEVLLPHPEPPELPSLVRQVHPVHSVCATA